MTSRAARFFALLLGVAAGPFLAGAASGTNDISLVGDSDGSVVRLYWIIQKWPPGATGFEVRSRPIDGAGQPSGPWIVLTPKPVAPGTSATGDLQAVEADAGERGRLASKRQSILSTGKLKTATFEALRSAFDGDPSLPVSLALSFSKDYDLALITGFGFVDRSSANRGPREYGLFAVPNGGEGDVPLAALVVDAGKYGDSQLNVAGPAATAEPGGIRVSWSLDAETARRFSVATFNVYRSEASAGSTVEIGSVDAPQSTPAVTVGITDSGADPKKAYVYSVAPVNAFGREFPSRTRITYSPDQALVPNVTLSEPKTDPSGKVVLSWSVAPGTEASITEFQVESAQVPSGSFAPVATGLAPSARSFVDGSDKPSGIGFAYRIAALRGPATAVYSAAQFYMRIDLPKPPMPQSLKAELAQVEGGTAVHLTWAAQGPDDHVTTGYALYCDSVQAGNLVREAGIPLLSGAEYYYMPGILNGRHMTLGLAGVGDGGQTGPVATVALDVPGSIPAPATGVSCRRDDPNSPVVVSWQYSDPGPIAGFRVYVGSTMVAGEDSLGPDKRQWSQTISDPRSTFAFEVRAVSLSGAVSMPAQAHYSTPTGGTVLAAVENLKATWAGTIAEPSISLSWDPDSQAASFAYAIDAKLLGQFGARSGLATSGANSASVSVGDPKRSYTVRMWPVGAGGSLGPYADVTLMGQGKSLPPASLPLIYALQDDDRGTEVQWNWDYPDAPGLAGFRIYQDGAVVANIDTLPRTARSWTSGPLRAGKKCVFRLVAVGSDGSESEAGPDRTVLHYHH